MIGGQAGIVGHIQIADGTKINAQSGVSKSIKHTKYSSLPAHLLMIIQRLTQPGTKPKLPELEKRLTELEKLIKQLHDRKRVSF